MLNLILLRGLPGAGKTTLANLLLTSESADFSADEYFTYAKGKYVFDAAQLPDAHAWCQREVRAYLQAARKNAVNATAIVHNTGTSDAEVEDYQRLADECQAGFFSIIVENRHNGVSTHNVPPHTIERMRERFSVKL